MQLLIFNRSLTALFLGMAIGPLLAIDSKAIFPTQTSRTTPLVNFPQIFINGIHYHLPGRTVLQKLGTPQNSSEVKLCYGKVTRLRYPGMTVDIQKDNQGKFVSGIEITGPKLGIDGVVKIGDSIDKAKQAYGNEILQIKTNKLQWYARPNHSEIALGFTTNQAGKIIKITIVVDC
jgi:hypothetical protein